MPRLRSAARRPLPESPQIAARRWRLAVAASAGVVVVVVLATAIGWLASGRSHVTRYAVAGALTRIQLKVYSGQVVIVGSSVSTVQVRRSDDYAFGHDGRERRSLAGGVLHITSRCPDIVVGSCSASYELAVPETVAVTVETTSGKVRLTGFRGNAAVHTTSGDVDVEAYCGFNLSATSRSGDLHVGAACAPQHLTLSAGSGSATALVPPGRYQISASSGDGRERVSGVSPDPRAPFTISAHSGSGSVSVGGGL